MGGEIHDIDIGATVDDQNKNSAKSGEGGLVAGTGYDEAAFFLFTGDVDSPQRLFKGIGDRDGEPAGGWFSD